MSIAKKSPLATAEEVREFLRISQGTYYVWMREGKLPFYKIGKRNLHDLDEILELARQTPKGQDK